LPRFLPEAAASSLRCWMKYLSTAIDMSRFVTWEGREGGQTSGRAGRMAGLECRCCTSRHPGATYLHGIVEYVVAALQDGGLALSEDLIALGDGPARGEAADIRG
jgi:hypothetical protein